MGRLSAHPALLIIDMQNGFCHAEGCFGMLGLPVSRHEAAIPSILKAKEMCNKHSIPVIYTKVEYAPDYSNAEITLRTKFAVVKDLKGFVENTWDSEIMEKLAPAKGDIVVSKTRNNAFHATELASTLRKLGVDQIIATGVGTNVCVESTVREARTHDFDAVTIKEATACLSDKEQEASEINLDYYGGVLTMKELEEELQGR